MVAGITRVAEVTKWAALALVVIAFVFLLVALPASLDETLSELFFFAGLASGALAMIVTIFAILVNVLAWGVRQSTNVRRTSGRLR